MSGISRETLFGKLNPIAYQSVESATVFCKMRGNPYVELVHWLAQLVQTPGPTSRRSFATTSSRRRRWRATSPTALDRLPRGSTSISDFSDHIEDSIKNGWLYGTLMFGQAQVRTGYLVIGMLQSKNLYERVDRHLAAVRSHQGRSAERQLRPGLRRHEGSDARRARRLEPRGRRRRRARHRQRRHGAGGDGQAGGAEEVLHRPHRAGPRRRRWTR